MRGYCEGVWRVVVGRLGVFFFFKQKTAYEMPKRLEFRPVLFRSLGGGPFFFYPACTLVFPSAAYRFVLDGSGHYGDCDGLCRPGWMGCRTSLEGHSSCSPRFRSLCRGACGAAGMVSQPISVQPGGERAA